jgi:hypothetical protein
MGWGMEIGDLLRIEGAGDFGRMGKLPILRAHPASLWWDS